MNELLEKLLAHLKLEIGACRELLSETKKEKEAIVASDIEAINAVCLRKQILVERINRLNSERLGMKPALTEHFGIDQDEFSLTNLSGLVKEPYSSRIKADCQRIKELIEKVNETNRTNTVLLENSLELVRGALDLLNYLSFGGGMYGPAGKVLNEDQQGRFVSETC